MSIFTSLFLKFPFLCVCFCLQVRAIVVDAVHRLDAPQPEERAVRALHAHQLCQVGAPEFDCGLLLVPNGKNGVLRERPLGIYLLFDDLLGKRFFFKGLIIKNRITL
jgi:hypothetical protein